MWHAEEVLSQSKLNMLCKVFNLQKKFLMSVMLNKIFINMGNIYLLRKSCELDHWRLKITFNYVYLNLKVF